MPHHLVRCFWLFLLGVLLTPLAGYAGAFVLFWIILWWLMQLLLFLTGAGVNPQFLDLFFVPGVYGIKWAWPTTCVVFPVVGAYWITSNMLTPLVLALLGLVCGFVTISVVAAIDPQSIALNDRAYFAAAGSVAGAIVGAAFGFALWRIDLEYKKRLGPREVASDYT